MIDFEYKQFTENELDELIKNNRDDIMILSFCDYYFSFMSFYPMYSLYDDCDVYIMKRTDKNIKNMKYLSAYDDKIENMDEFTGDETNNFINEYFENVYFHIYFGHS